jgi:hypothetical protein
MTVRALRAEMPHEEYVKWYGFYQYQHNRRDQARRQKIAEKEAKEKGKNVRRRCS